MTGALINALSLNADLLEKITALQAECAAFYQSAGDAQAERDAAREERDALKAECDAMRADARHRFADALAEALRDVLSPYARSGDFDDAATTIAAYDAAIDNERSKA